MLNFLYYRYSPEQLYDIVADIDSYKNFVPWCLGSKVKNKLVRKFWLNIILFPNFTKTSEF